MLNNCLWKGVGGRGEEAWFVLSANFCGVSIPTVPGDRKRCSYFLQAVRVGLASWIISTKRLGRGERQLEGGSGETEKLTNVENKKKLRASWEAGVSVKGVWLRCLFPSLKLWRGGKNTESGRKQIFIKSRKWQKARHWRTSAKFGDLWSKSKENQTCFS